jgi:aspartate aminotransferase-like enzyme
MREALQIVGEVGLGNMWATHKRLHEDLWRGLAPLGLQPFVERPADRLVTVNTIKARPGPELFNACVLAGVRSAGLHALGLMVKPRSGACTSGPAG